MEKEECLGMENKNKPNYRQQEGMRQGNRPNKLRPMRPSTGKI